MDKRGIEMSLNTIITLIIVALVLVFLTIVVKDKLGIIFK